VDVAALQNEAPVPPHDAIFASFRLRSRDSGSSSRPCRRMSRCWRWLTWCARRRPALVICCRIAFCGKPAPTFPRDVLIGHRHQIRHPSESWDLGRWRDSRETPAFAGVTAWGRRTWAINAAR